MQNLMRHPPPPPGYAITVFTQSEPTHGQCILKRRRFHFLYVHINNYS